MKIKINITQEPGRGLEKLAVMKFGKSTVIMWVPF